MACSTTFFLAGTTGLDDSPAWLFLFAPGEMEHPLLSRHARVECLGVDDTHLVVGGGVVVVVAVK